MYHTHCKSCGQPQLEYFPVEANSKKRRFGALAITVFVLSLVAILACAVILILYSNEYINAISNSDDSLSGAINTTYNAAKIISLWVKTVKAIEVFAIILGVSVVVYMLLPYKRTITVIAVCQACGSRFELEDKTYTYYNNSDYHTERKPR